MSTCTPPSPGSESRSVLDRLMRLRDECATFERAHAERLKAFEHAAAVRTELAQASARNLLHYLSVRRHDLRALHAPLAEMGLSSLGRMESHVLANLNAVIRAANALSGERIGTSGVAFAPVGSSPEACLSIREAESLIERRTESLLGPVRAAGQTAPAQPGAAHSTEHSSIGGRIMVTLPSEAADAPELVASLLRAGMTCARINAAHDDEAAWVRMCGHVREQSTRLGMHCKIIMDLCGPKLRTGPFEPGPEVVRAKPVRDALGRTISPATLMLVAADSTSHDTRFDAGEPAASSLGAFAPPLSESQTGAASGPLDVPVNSEFLRGLRVGDAIELFDTRGRRRVLKVREVGSTGGVSNGCRVRVTSDRTVYVGSGAALRLLKRKGSSEATENGRVQEGRVGQVQPVRQVLAVRVGDRVRLSLTERVGRVLASVDGHHASRTSEKHDGSNVGSTDVVGILTCTLSEAFARVNVGESVWIDDGRVGLVVESIGEDGLTLRVTHAAGSSGAASGTGDRCRIREDKGINLPESDVAVSGLTQQDIAVLPIAAKHADMVGLSFVREESDVLELRRRLDDLGGHHVGTVLKIETQRAFENLPTLLLAALKGPTAGVMIARGDLAVEVGYDRLAEVQEEILWLCEAAHVPVIWATQVLETMAKTGRPSRAEVTDAAMGERAECVMLNKGPHVVEATAFLSNLMQRMRGHQSKKRSVLRALNVAKRFAHGIE